jgi:hypothetical protein
MTLKEFLLHYPDIVIDEEEWWTDVDVENFYLYVTHSQVHLGEGDDDERTASFIHSLTHARLPPRVLVDVWRCIRGWPEWANRYAVKCPQCEATNWVGPDFVSAEAEHKLEEALGEQPDEIME